MILTTKSPVTDADLTKPALRKVEAFFEAAGVANPTIGDLLGLDDDTLKSIGLAEANIAQLTKLAKTIKDELPAFVDAKIVEEEVQVTQRVQRFSWEIGTLDLAVALRPHVEETLGKLPDDAEIEVTVFDPERVDVEETALSITVKVPVAA